jgi:hypothetical protein
VSRLASSNQPPVPGTLDFTYHHLSSGQPAVTNGNYRHLESQFLQTPPSTIPTFLPPRFRRGQVLCIRMNELGTRESATGDSQRLHPCQLALAATRSRGKGAAERARGRSQRDEGLPLLLRLGKRRSIEPKRLVGVCLHACSGIKRHRTMHGAYPTALLALRVCLCVALRQSTCPHRSLIT